MKIQCEVCEREEAEVLCSADEAVLCKGCDEKVHAANMLSQKHERVSLLKHPSSSSSSSSSSASQHPSCDVCQEKKGVFFCLEDRALLCRLCDASTHLASPYLLSHQRFLIADVKVALQSNNGNNQSLPISNTALSDFPIGEESRTAMRQLDVGVASTETTATFLDELCLATEPHWPLDEILGSDIFNYCEFSDMESSRISSQ